MSARLPAARAAARRAMPSALLGLDEWLRVPSVSGDPRRREYVAAAAHWIKRRLSRLTPNVRLIEAPGGPVVLARVRSAASQPGSTTVVYGHLDVKEPGPGWTTPPFEPTLRGHRLIARGASDDKGQLMAHIAALEAYAAIGGPPQDVAVIVDGAEEIGSPGLSHVLRSAERESLLRGPVSSVVVSDTRMAGPGRPTLTVSQRGMLSLRVRVSTGDAPVHAGRFGGAVLDPSVVLARALLRTGRALEAMGASNSPRAEAPTDASVRAAVRGRAVHADQPAARSTVRGALTVTTLRAGAAAGSIPPTAEAVLDIRLPPGVEPAPVLTQAIRLLRTDGVRTAVDCLGSVRGISVEHPPEILAAVRIACRLGFGTPPVTVASGGSIPAVRLLGDVFGQPPVLLGLGPANDGAHGPDEYLDLRDWERGIDSCVCLLAALARAAASRSCRETRLDRRSLR